MNSLPQTTLFQEYFLPVSSRNTKKTLFYKFIGYDEPFLSFLSRYFSEAKTNGSHITSTLENPKDIDVKFFMSSTGGELCYTQDGRKLAVSKWLPELNPAQQRCLLAAMEEVLSHFEPQAANENILKNTFIKLLCWLKYSFKELLFRLPFNGAPKILYEGLLGKYQLLLFKIFERLGCDIAVTDFEGGSCQNVNLPPYFAVPQIELAQRGTPPLRFTEIDWEASKKAQSFQKEMERTSDAVITNQWADRQDLLEEVFKSSVNRGGYGNKIYNVFCEYRGVSDKEMYDSLLFQFKGKLDKQKKPYVIAEKEIDSPTVEETRRFADINRENKQQLMQTLTEKFHFYQPKELELIGKRALYSTLETAGTGNLSKLYNLGVTMLCWLSRYKETLFAYDGKGQVPLFIFYGCCQNKNEGIFLRLLSEMAVDTIIFCPDLDMKSGLTEPKLLRIEGPVSLPITDFPRNERRTAAPTAAYNAQRELDTILYSDTGLYRQKQFRDSLALNLKTTYEEIDILWNEEAKYRPYFETSDERVTVPNILAKISGVKNADTAEYIESVRKKIDKNTIVIEKVPYLKGTDFNPIKSHAAKLVKNKILQTEEIKKHSAYAYDYLPKDVQDFILFKIQALIDEDMIEADTGGIEYAIVSVLLNLDKNTIRMIQNFDFTGRIPKVILINTSESMGSLEDSIYIMFLSLIGFDILIYSPPGYRVVDKYLKNNILKEHIIGEYVFDMELPALNGGGRSSKSFIEKLFGKGKN